MPASAAKTRRKPRLTPRQERAVLALLNEPTIKRAAEVAHVGERTLARWLRQAVFAEAFEEARREAFDHALSLTQKYAAMAVHTFAKVMSDPVSTSASKVSAASALLKFGTARIAGRESSKNRSERAGASRPAA